MARMNVVRTIAILLCVLVLPGCFRSKNTDATGKRERALVDEPPKWTGSGTVSLLTTCTHPAFGTRKWSQSITVSKSIELRMPGIFEIFRWIDSESRVADYAKDYRSLLMRLRNRKTLSIEDFKSIDDLRNYRYVASADGLRLPDRGRSAYLTTRIEQLKSLFQESPSPIGNPSSQELKTLMKQWIEQSEDPAEWILAGEGLVSLRMLKEKEFQQALTGGLAKLKRDPWLPEGIYWQMARLMQFRTALEKCFLANDDRKLPDFPLEEFEALHGRFQKDLLQHRPVVQLVFAEIQVLLAEQIQDGIDIEWKPLALDQAGKPAGEIAPERKLRLSWSRLTGPAPLARLVWEPGSSPAHLQWADADPVTPSSETDELENPRTQE